MAIRNFACISLNQTKFLENSDTKFTQNVAEILAIFAVPLVEIKPKESYVQT
jgi:hypothetical protein